MIECTANNDVLAGLERIQEEIVKMHCMISDISEASERQYEEVHVSAHTLSR